MAKLTRAFVLKKIQLTMFKCIQPNQNYAFIVLKYKCNTNKLGHS